jgi:hypothetical protein
MPPPFKEQISKSGTLCEKEPLPETWLCVDWNLEALVGVIMGSGKGTRVNENVKCGVMKWTAIIGFIDDITSFEIFCSLNRGRCRLGKIYFCVLRGICSVMHFPFQILCYGFFSWIYKGYCG